MIQLLPSNAPVTRRPVGPRCSIACILQRPLAGFLYGRYDGWMTTQGCHLEQANGGQIGNSYATIVRSRPIAQASEFSWVKDVIHSLLAALWQSPPTGLLLRCMGLPRALTITGGSGNLARWWKGVIRRSSIRLPAGFERPRPCPEISKPQSLALLSPWPLALPSIMVSSASRRPTRSKRRPTKFSPTSKRCSPVSQLLPLRKQRPKPRTLHRLNRSKSHDRKLKRQRNHLLRAAARSRRRRQTKRSHGLAGSR